MAGNTSQACGGSGGPCTACATYQSCSGGKCNIDPNSDWKVTVVNAGVDPSSGPWDPGAPLTFVNPDPYVKVTSGGLSGETGTENDTFSPLFNDMVLTAKAKDLTTLVNIRTYDEDPIPPDQIMGDCSLPFTYGDLAAGTRTVAPCGASVTAVNFTFAPK